MFLMSILNNLSLEGEPDCIGILSRNCTLELGWLRPNRTGTKLPSDLRRESFSPRNVMIGSGKG